MQRARATLRRAGVPRWAALACVVALTSCGSGEAVEPRRRLAPCASDRGLGDALCGTLRVPEDRSAPEGRTIELSIVILPARREGAEPDPLFFLAGGPGQGAAELAARLAPMLSGVQQDRDVVLVDQRGTGRSAELDCRDDLDPVAALLESDEASLERLRGCLAAYEADVRQYTTPVAMDDLDAVRAHLGYEKVNLYGVSYGTRAALAYLRQHGDRVRTAVLDGVAPASMALPRAMGRDGQRALDALVADCEADAGCDARYPRLGERIVALVGALEAAPREVVVVHPRTGERVPARIDARVFVHVLFAALYSPIVSALVPEIVSQVERGIHEGLLALAMMNEGVGSELSVGMQLSVVCSEDRTAPEAGAPLEGSRPVFGDRLLASLVKACEFWPRGALPADYHAPVESDVPVLLLSGELDPVTPPAWAEAVAAGLSRSRSVVLRATGHGAITTHCGRKLVKDFVSRGEPQSLDVGCAAEATRPPFFLGPAGPDPKATRRGGTP